MVAHRGMTKPATGLEIPFFNEDSSVTGMVAAEDDGLEAEADAEPARQELS